MVALTHLICFLIFRRELLMFWLPFSLWCLCGYFIRMVSMLAGDRRISSQFRKVHLHPLLPLANYRPISITPCSVVEGVRAFVRQLSVRLRWFMDGSGVPPTIKFSNRKGLGTSDRYTFVRVPYCKVHWRVGKRVGFADWLQQSHWKDQPLENSP